MFSLESPHRCDHNENTQYTMFNIKKKKTLNYPKSAVMGFFSKGLKNESETAVVIEPSVFEPLRFYCILFNIRGTLRYLCTRYRESTILVRTFVFNQSRHASFIF